MLENNEQEICELFLQLEEKNELFEKLEVNNIKIWHYIRYEIYNLILQILGIFKNPNLDKVYYKKQDTIKDWIDKEILKNQFNIKHKEVFILNHQRRIKQGDYYKCNYTDEWLKKFNRSYYVFELQHADNFHFKPVKTKNLRYIDQVQFMKIFHKKYCTESVCHKESKKVADYLIKILENAFEIVFGVKEKKKIMQIIVHKVTARDGLKDYYGYLLKRIKPKIIIYVVGTGFDQMILGETGRELGIPTVEIQHGHIGRGHLGYNFNCDVCLNSFPEYLFVTGQHEVEAIRPPIPKENIYITGSPELDFKVNYYKKKLQNRKKLKKIITFISGGEREIVDAAIEMYQKLDKDQYKIYLKLHPSEYTSWRKKYCKLENSGVCVVDGSLHDIYYYLAISDYLVGVASAVLFEATRFECDIMVLKTGRYFNAESLINTGNGVYISSTEEAIKRIHSMSSKRTTSDFYHRRNSCQLIYRAIDAILDKKGEEQKSENVYGTE